MVVSPSGKLRKSTLRKTVARVLVLGDRQVGKSAAIVRYTTGRFIENYCSATSDWLYRHPLGYDSAQNQYKFVELLEQSDVQFSSIRGSSTSSTSSGGGGGGGSSSGSSSSSGNIKEPEEQERRRLDSSRAAANALSSRVALDRQIDNELHERQQLLSKLHWANAYVVIYAINDSRSFNRAIRYLNLIANEVNAGPNQQVLARQAQKSRMLAAAIQANGDSPAHQHQQWCRRPILLVGNKRDLDRPTASGARSQARRISQTDGRLLAMRHQCLFAELSISETGKPIELALTSLIDLIRPSELHSSPVDNLSADLQDQILTRLQPARGLSSSPTETVQQQRIQQHQHQTSTTGPQPIWSSLVRTRLPQSYSSSQRIPPSCGLAGKAKRLKEADARLSKPVGHRGLSSSGSSSSASSSSTVSKAGSPLALPQAQTAGPLLAMVADVQLIRAPEPAMALRLVATRPSISSLSSNGSGGSSRSHLGLRYESFKSSFRKASLAIVGLAALERHA